ncbi:hypothetical protein NHX12_026319 [Muraenolepis orangiensis]|uniref:Uncharacterized protein n=1 Tax=Muraenolepis orangiensis TaxID=630683 RepID=A0A9Q0EK13_9TELE|nr:hypothetical protein NHX12_026319 [Muraenolepis orangiensis]
MGDLQTKGWATDRAHIFHFSSEMLVCGGTAPSSSLPPSSSFLLFHRCPRPQASDASASPRPIGRREPEESGCIGPLLLAACAADTAGSSPGVGVLSQ